VEFEGEDIYRTPRELGLSLCSEITMTNLRVAPPGRSMQIFVKTLDGETIVVWVESCDCVENFKYKIRTINRLQVDIQRLLLETQLEDDRALSDYNIQKGTTLHLIERLKGRGCAPTPTMSFGAGGTIKQTIEEDHNNPRIWDLERAKIFNGGPVPV
jgi:hypothetical protein